MTNSQQSLLEAATELKHRRAARSDIYEFSKQIFKSRKGYDFLEAPHHKVICDALMRVYHGDCKRLIINVPPRYSKTELAVVNFIAWALGNVPDAEFIHASYSSSLAVNNSSQIRSVVQNEYYAKLFTDTQLETEAQHHWRTTAGGVMYATGTGGTITGYGAGKQREGFGGAIIIDDPHKADEALSNVVRQGVLDWFQNTLESRKNSSHTPIIVIMQRLHSDDLAGWLLAGGNGEKWEHVCLPAIQEDGTALWPAKHSLENLRVMESKASYVFAGQYLQQPYKLGGGLIKGAWFKEFDVPPRMEWRAIFADTAQKTKERNDYSVFQCWGKGSDGKLYLLDLIRGKWESVALKASAVSFWHKHKSLEPYKNGELRCMYVEDAASGTGLIQSIQHDREIPIQGITRVKDKLTRLMDVQGYLQSEYCCIPQSAPWTSDFLTECESFTADNTHAHDDQIDPMIDAINAMMVDLSVSPATGGSRTF